MKVAYLFGSTNRGGAEKLMSDIFRNKDELLFSPICIYRKGGNILGEFNSTGIPLYHLAPKNRFDLLYLLRLRRFLKTEGVSIVHAQQSVDALFAYIACYLLPIRIVLTIHGFQIKKIFLMKLSSRLVVKHLDLLIFVSKFQQRYFQEKFSLGKKHPNTIIYNGVSFSEAKKIIPIPLRKEIGASQEELILCTVGSFSSGRDHMTLCRFIKILHEQDIKFKFVFVGPQNIAEHWLYEECVDYCKQNQLENIVFFMGLSDKVPDILAQSDAFIYSSRHDTFGIAVIEAIASGIPVFVNDWGVMLEITDDGNRAEIYKTGSEKDLLKKFVHYFRNVETYRINSHKNSIWAKEKYSIKGHIKKLNEAYNDILK